MRYWYISTNTDTFGAAQGGVPVVGGELGLVQCLSAVHPRPLSICNAGRDPRCPPPAASKLVVLLPCNIQITSSEVLEHFRCPIKYVKDAVLAPELAAYENLRLCIEVGWVKKSHPTCGVIRCIFCMSTSTRTISVCVVASRSGQ